MTAAIPERRCADCAQPLDLTQPHRAATVNVERLSLDPAVPGGVAIEVLSQVGTTDVYHLDGCPPAPAVMVCTMCVPHLVIALDGMELDAVRAVHLLMAHDPTWTGTG